MASAKEALLLLKLGAPERREAALIISDPAGSKARALSKIRTALQEQYSGSYIGTYKLDSETIPFRENTKIEAIKKRNLHGRYGIEIGKFKSDGTLILYLFDPERPKTRELHLAKVAYTAEGGLELECKPLVDKSSELAPDTVHILHCTTSLKLKVGPEGIEGRGLNRLISYQVKLTGPETGASTR